jgi:hypothetical protein
MWQGIHARTSTSGASSDYTLNVRVYSFFRTEDEKNDELEILGARSHAHPYVT